MHLRRPAVIFIALTLSLPALAETHDAIFSQLDSFTATLSEITGWPVKKKVPAEIISKAKFQNYLQAHTRDRGAQKEIHAEETALKMLGLVPQTFNLARETEDLLGEQAAAYYDYKKKRLYIIDSTPEGDDQRMALVHELAHALADQQHFLGKYLAQSAANSDASTAREAVMEGQATWLTWAYEAKRVGQKAEVPLSALNELTRSDDNSSYPVLAAAPLYMRESLLFPYNAGARFQDAVYRRQGRQSFDSVFARGPVSTHEIMHPQQYLDEKAALTVTQPSYEKILGSHAGEFRGVIDSTLGEFDHAILLRQYIGEKLGPAAASHILGSGFRVYEHKKEKYPVLTYWSEWDSPASAQAFFEFYQQIMKAKWKKLDVTAQSATEISGIGDSGKFVLRIVGQGVQSVEGLQ